MNHSCLPRVWLCQPNMYQALGMRLNPKPCSCIASSAETTELWGNLPCLQTIAETATLDEPQSVAHVPQTLHQPLPSKILNVPLNPPTPPTSNSHTLPTTGTRSCAGISTSYGCCAAASLILLPLSESQDTPPNRIIHGSKQFVNGRDGLARTIASSTSVCRFRKICLHTPSSASQHIS